MGFADRARERLALRACRYLERRRGYDVVRVRGGAGGDFYPLYMAAMPQDGDGRMLFLDDAVTERGRLCRVVAMSHRQKVAIRDAHDASGRHARWVPSSSVLLADTDAKEAR